MKNKYSEDFTEYGYEKQGSCRYWTCVLFVPDLKVNWKQILGDELTYPAVAYSPLHHGNYKPKYDDKIELSDLFEKHEYKGKDHYHLVLQAPNTTTENHIQGLCNRLYKEYAPRVEAVGNPLGIINYLIHWGEKYKHKEQFCFDGFPDYDLITCDNGFDLTEFIEKQTKKDLERNFDLLMQIIAETHITEFWDLSDYLYKNNMRQLLYITRHHSNYCDKLLRSFNHTLTFSNKDDYVIDY